MGQYHQLVNFTKKEFVDPHQFGNGLKLWEQIGWEHAFSNVTHMLIASCSGRGGGDFAIDGKCEYVVGRWGGDRIALVGDYAKVEDFTLPEHEFRNMMADLWGGNDEPVIISTSYKQPRDAYGRFASNKRQENTRTTYRDISPLVAAAYGELFQVQFVGMGWKEIKNIKDTPDTFNNEFSKKVLNSSLVKHIEWNKNKELKIKLSTNQDEVYVYEGVPSLVAYNFLDSQSKGKFFNTYIKGKYDSYMEDSIK